MVEARPRTYAHLMAKEIEANAEQILAASKSQFGKNAANYATSTVHAKGASLGRIVEMLAPHAGWRALDIATAAGPYRVCRR